jgi:hypothetical protein
LVPRHYLISKTWHALSRVFEEIVQLSLHLFF